MDIRTCLRVEGTLSPIHPPKPWLNCAACGQVRTFSPTGKARLNAKGRRLDAWLLYRCDMCGGSWKRPLLIRRAVAEVDRTFLQALQANEAGLMARLAHDRDALRQHCQRIEDAAHLRLKRRLLTPPPTDPKRLVVSLRPLWPLAVRLDRPLAQVVGPSRNRLAGLAAEGWLGPGASDVLRRPFRGPVQIELTLDHLPEAPEVIALQMACSTEGEPDWSR